MKLAALLPLAVFVIWIGVAPQAFLRPAAPRRSKPAPPARQAFTARMEGPATAGQPPSRRSPLPNDIPFRIHDRHDHIARYLQAPRPGTGPRGRGVRRLGGRGLRGPAGAAGSWPSSASVWRWPWPEVSRPPTPRSPPGRSHSTASRPTSAGWSSSPPAAILCLVQGATCSAPAVTRGTAASPERAPAKKPARSSSCSPGLSLVGVSNDLVLLFVGLELVSIPPTSCSALKRSNATARRLASSISSCRWSPRRSFCTRLVCLYGIGGSTSLAAIGDALLDRRARSR